jgi:hypothetical protein
MQHKDPFPLQFNEFDDWTLDTELKVHVAALSAVANVSIFANERADKSLLFCEFRFTFIPTAIAIANTAIPPIFFHYFY